MCRGRGGSRLAHPSIRMVSINREREQQTRWLTQKTSGTRCSEKNPELAAPLQMAASMGPLVRKYKWHILENHT